MGENSTGLHGQQGTAQDCRGSRERRPPPLFVCLPIYLSSPFFRKDVDAEIIPEKSKINAMRKNGPSGKRLVLLLFVNVNRSATGQLRGYKYSRSTDAG